MLQRYLHPTLFTVGLLHVKEFRHTYNIQKLHEVYTMQQKKEMIDEEAEYVQKYHHWTVVEVVDIKP